MQIEGTTLNSLEMRNHGILFNNSRLKLKVTAECSIMRLLEYLAVSMFAVRFFYSFHFQTHWVNVFFVYVVFSYSTDKHSAMSME